MKCPRCEAENDTGARFCEDCGARLETACPSCGSPVTPGKKFCRSCGAALTTEPVARFASPESYTPKHLAEKILTSKGVLEGERKQVTVLFADLKSSMEMLADRDPEEARKLLDPVLERMMEAVHRYEGTVNQVMGDGIMALFGAPVAHEDHAVRACYAALRMQEAVRTYADEARRAHGVNVQIRVGVNSGEVVVRAIGSDLRMDYTAVGQTTHLAGRMEQLASPGSILLTPSTLQLVEGYVAVTPLGPVPVRGLAEPLEVYEVTGAGPARTRLQAAMRRGLTRFVGREAELDALRRALEQAASDHGQIVAIVGEAGVGKSRLLYEFTRSHRMQGWLVLETVSVSYGKATSYLPVIELLKGYFKIQDRDDLREIREKVTGKLLTLDRALEPALPALLSLLDVPMDDASWRGLDPIQRRQRTVDAVKRLLLREAREQPLLLIFEDLRALEGPSRYERFGQANLPAVQSRAFLAACHAELGMFAEGHVLAEDGLGIAEVTTHPSSIMWAQYGLGVLALRQGHVPRALSRLERALGIGEDAHLPLFVPRVAAALAEAYQLAGRAADAEPLLARAMEQTVTPEMTGFQALCRIPLGQAHLIAGRLDEARAEAEQALALAREHGERGNEAYALRLLGEVHSHEGVTGGDEAPRSYREAMALATELEMRPLIAHCHLGLGKLHRRAGKRDQAREHLVTATAMYRDLAMSFWLEEAETAA